MSGNKDGKVSVADLVSAGAIVDSEGRLASLGTGISTAPSPSGVAATDTASLVAAIAAAPAGGSVQLQAGTYVLNQVTIDKRLTIFGAGRNRSGTVIQPALGETGPLINWNNSTLRPGCSLLHLKFDMTANPIQAVYMHNVRNGTIDDVYIDTPTIGLQLDLAQAMYVRDVDIFNASQSAFLCSHASSSGCTFINCFSDSTTVTGVAGFDVTAGLDWWFIGCRAFRAPGSGITLQYGWRIAYASTNTNATVALLRCSVDGISDLTSGSTTVAGVWMQKVGNCIISNCHLSGFDQAGATHNTTIKLDQVNSVRIQDNWISGRGIDFTGTASDSVKVTNNQFYGSDANGFQFKMTVTPTLLDARGNTLGNGSFNIPITNTPAAYYGSLLREAQAVAGLNLNRPPGALFESLNCQQVNLITTALTSGTLYLFAVWLPKGLPVTNINWMSGSTALVNSVSPHYWVAFYTNAKAFLAQSPDDTAAVIAANTLKTTALSAQQITTYEGIHYIGVMVNSGGGTQPTIANFASASAIANLGAVRAATADTGLLGVAPSPAGATANIANLGYVYVT